MKFKHFFIWVLPAALLLLPCNRVWAAFGEDSEKPKPKFSQSKSDWVAELTPRGKSSPIKILFQVNGGTMTSVNAKEFSANNAPDVDKKTFRSDFYVAEIEVNTPGGDVSFSVDSDYFTTATELWAPEKRGSQVWKSMGAENVGHDDRTNTLTIKLRDGGPMDADGKADGRIELVFGPMDSFWGYALGTLFIRFFGVFLVLGVLEIGMIVSGKIFQSLEIKEKKAIATTSVSKPAKAESIAEGAASISPEIAAAIAVALNLEANDKGTTPSIKPLTPMARPTVVTAAAPQPKPAPKPAEPIASPGNPENAMKAPIPGVIIDIKAAVGDKVMEGETLIILEAMKMENDLVAEKSGTVTEILVQKGQQVSTGDSLIVIT